MRIKKTSLLYVFTVIIVFGFVVFFLGKDRSLSAEEQEDTDVLERKIKELERDLKQNYEIVQRIGKSVSDLLKESAIVPEEKIHQTVKSWGDKLGGKAETNDCLFAESAPLGADIKMLDLYEKTDFVNQDGGVWKQGWDVQYDPSQFTAADKLKVFLVPHSHNDPGWIKTFEKYYEEQTRHIFNNMVRKLSEDSSRKFIWAEISYLDLWWKEATSEDREKFKHLVETGQIEIVTGGWVMNDEANTHYFAMIEQLTSGHEWLKQNLDVQPKNGWAIDPFGMSSSMAYLLKRSGFENMVIQRVHYSVKKALAFEKNLEFRWRQNWDHDGQTDMFCHMMPFYSYDVPHTCGPDPKICCQFDFRRLSGNGQTPIGCPWKIAPVPITDANVAKKAAVLLDQYRKKSSLYKTNVLLVQLGDDFRYDTAMEFDQQFNNYQKLFDYMNSRKDWFIEAQFGTLQDYFDTLRSSVAKKIERFPSLSGDFFTYADVSQHYWSGYYTTRPFYKHLDRVLQSYLRSAEIIYSMTWTHQHRLSAIPDTLIQWMSEMMVVLNQARHHLGLFQHHDGVTGTAKDHVVHDYARKMQTSIRKSQLVIDQCAHYLLHPDQSRFNPQWGTEHFIVDDPYAKPNELPDKTLVEINNAFPSRSIVLYNSLASERVQVITLRVSHHNVQVLNEKSEAVKVQLSPVFVTPHQISFQEFEISFIASVPPLGMTTYVIHKFDGSLQENKDLEVSGIIIKESRTINTVDPFHIEMHEELKPFQLSNAYQDVSFDSFGLLKSITHEGKRIPVAVQFVRYGTERDEKSTMSGAYLFLPDGPAKLISPQHDNHHVRIIRGSIRSQVVVHLPFVVHQVTLYHSPGMDGVGLEIDNLVNLAGQANLEIAMRFVSSLKSDRAFYSDLNGLQMTRRERWDKLPLQAHFYPMPTMAYIEDSSFRLSVASKQPLGAASLQSGHLEVMLDRRLNQDDNRGLGQGVLDNVIPTLNSFRLLIEPRIPSCKGSKNRPDGYPSLTGHKTLHDLLYPIHQLVLKDNLQQDLHPNFKPAKSENGADIHLVNLRTGATLNNEGGGASPAQSVALLLHRLGFDCCFPVLGSNGSTKGGEFSVDMLFPDYFGNKVQATSLTQLEAGPAIEKSFTIALKAMEIYTFQLQP